MKPADIAARLLQGPLKVFAAGKPAIAIRVRPEGVLVRFEAPGSGSGYVDAGSLRERLT